MTRSYPEAIQEPTKSHLMRTKVVPITKEIPKYLGALCKTLHHLDHSGSYKGSRGSVSDTRAETMYISLIMSQHSFDNHSMGPTMSSFEKNRLNC